MLKNVNEELFALLLLCIKLNYRIFEKLLIKKEVSIAVLKTKYNFITSAFEISYNTLFSVISVKFIEKKLKFHP